ncbi:MAG TPA: NAD(P)-dependent oxidoreductase [Gaiellaceae bacterium]|nr:NAD(P)-dependent oxidoreductase [Gaiellaceae bacterium]
MTRIGFVGVGRLGGHLASSLVRAGFAVTVHDRERSAVEQLAASGAQVVDSPSAAATDADAVLTCLPSPDAVADVVAGDDGILSRMRPGATWIDTSTNDRHELLRLAARAAEHGVATLEAPVTGGVHLAAAGELTVIVGGDDEVVAAHMPLFQAMGRRVFHVGPLGRASDLKVITNMLAFVHLVACGEALMLAKRAGIDLRDAYEVIAASSGTSFVHETEGQVILSGSYDIGFTLDLALKDLAFAAALGEETGVPLELAAATRARFVEAAARYGGSAWSPTVVRLLEDEVGEELRAPGFPAHLG